jgi:N-ethylmaleimide reductase
MFCPIESDIVQSSFTRGIILRVVRGEAPIVVSHLRHGTLERQEIPEAAPMSTLFSSGKIGPYTFAHRVVFAPMTRLRSDPLDTPLPMMANFYGQRASSGGFLIAESAAISISSRSYFGAPGIYLPEHVIGWRAVTDAVHAKGGRIFLQIFHGGRQSHRDIAGGSMPVAPSVVPFKGMAKTATGFVDSSPFRALLLEEIPGILADFHRAAQLAQDAGFDGVELHGANGYLVDQFLQDGSNKRTDAYGGPVENRARFLFEALAKLIAVFGPDRVGLRLSPEGQWGDVHDSDPGATFSWLAARLSDYGLAYLHIIDPRIKGDATLHEAREPVAAAFIRKYYHGTLIAAGGFDGVQAQKIVDDGSADFVAFARWFSSNPDLPERLRNGWPLAPYKREAFWGGDEHGYTDFTSYADVSTAHVAEPFALCSAACTQCGLRGPEHSMSCSQSARSNACHAS